MMLALRSFFLGRLLREKLLLVVFTLLGVLMWLSSYSKRAGAFWRAQHTTTVALADQQQWLDNRKALEESAKKAAQSLEPSKTLDGTRLLATVTSLASESGLRNTNSGQVTNESNGKIAMHTLPYTINRADWDSLKKFYLAVSAKSPYIGLERFALLSDRANPAQLNLSVTVTSVEITP
jgi:hypothetical protein